MYRYICKWLKLQRSSCLLPFCPQLGVMGFIMTSLISDQNQLSKVSPNCHFARDFLRFLIQKYRSQQEKRSQNGIDTSTVSILFEATARLMCSHHSDCVYGWFCSLHPHHTLNPLSFREQTRSKLHSNKSRLIRSLLPSLKADFHDRRNSSKRSARPNLARSDVFRLV